MALISVVLDGKCRLISGKHSALAHHRKREFRHIPFFGSVTTAQHKQTYILTIILPVKDDTEAFEIQSSITEIADSSGNLIVSFVKDKMTHSYEFEMLDDGFRYVKKLINDI